MRYVFIYVVFIAEIRNATCNQ